MTKHNLNKPIYSLLLVLFFLTSCNGQMINNTGGDKVIKKGPPKLIKTQGSDKYQNVHCGLQDKKENLWFGTTGEGVYRYDGKSFIQFTVKDGLSSNTVWSILEDETGNIWFGTDDGICRYDGKTISIVPITTEYNMFNKNTATKNPVSSIMQDKSGKIWFGTDDGLYCYNGITFFRFIDNPDIVNKSGLTLKNVQCIFQEKNGNFWMGSGPFAQEGIIRFDGKTLENFKPKSEGWIRSIMQDKEGNILFATRHNGACCYDGKNFTFVSYMKDVVYNSMMTCFEDKAGNTWFASDYGTELNDSVGGAWRYDGKRLTKFTTKDGLTNNDVFLIFEDKSENIWIGTRNVGLYCYDGKTITSFSE